MEYILSSFAILLMQFAEICRGGATLVPTMPALRPWTTHRYQWACRSTGREHMLTYATAGCGEPVVLLHGFGGSVDYWRATIPPIAAAGYKVYALDMLGFGSSDKPTDVRYSAELWAELTLDFLDEFVQRPAVLVGNSLGSLVALSAAAGCVARRASDAEGGDAGGARPVVGALALLNCAGGMNSKFVLTDPERPRWQRALSAPIFALIDWVLTTPALRDRAFRAYASESTVRSILLSVYTRKERVDDELVRAILAPAADPAAAEVFGAILTGEPGVQPRELVSRVRVPILAIWGERDTFTPLDGPTGRLFAQLARERPASVAMRVIDAGHVPHDDDPAAVLAELLPFLAAHLKPQPCKTVGLRV
ncbi:hypothetical protein KFE25_005521 [Diacronema lutheri]|uniref:AB hydrolase-1 domain-containing protein n=2 Tax=Diacronema lutheri TaxID=2081491 RepID=A0A8J6CCC4_DIALT|nr:hypothetical protein KFE25_005521 [Diacronema lutheri]